MRPALALAVGTSLLSLALLGACVGDDPAAATGGTGSDGGASSSGDGGPSTSSSGQPACVGDSVDACGDTCTKCTAPTDGTVACTNRTCTPSCAAKTLCGDACVDTTTSAANCGKCGHSCGAGSCVAGACQPVTVATFTAVNGIAASPKGVVIAADSAIALCAKPEGCTATTSLTTIKNGVSGVDSVTVVPSGTSGTVFWDGNEGDFQIVYSCPLDGCPAGLATTVESVANDTIGRVVAGPNTVLWTRYNSYYGPYSTKCTPPACLTKDVVRPEPTTGPYYNDTTRETVVPNRIFSVGATTTVWATPTLYNDNNKQLRYCTYGTSCATPGEISRGTFYGVSALTYFNGYHYVAIGNSTSPTGDVIAQISDTTPSVPSALVGDMQGISAIAVDASGIYWVNGTTGRVARCATLTGCAGSGDTLATGQGGAFDIAVDDTYVYWATATAVRKVAK
jgi:hypothetical protein